MANDRYTRPSRSSRVFLGCGQWYLPLVRVGDVTLGRLWQIRWRQLAEAGAKPAFPVPVLRSSTKVQFYKWTERCQPGAGARPKIHHRKSID